MKTILAILLLTALTAFAANAADDPQQIIERLRVVVQYQQSVIDGKTVEAAILREQLAALQKQIDTKPDAKPDTKK